ncbi:hypothetical protein MCOR28_001747, partial [Pyricularia oryzae]
PRLPRSKNLRHADIFAWFAYYAAEPDGKEGLGADYYKKLITGVPYYAGALLDTCDAVHHLCSTALKSLPENLRAAVERCCRGAGSITESLLGSHAKPVEEPDATFGHFACV